MGGVDLGEERRRLLMELALLRERIAELEGAEASHRQAEHGATAEAMRMAGALRQSVATAEALLEAASEGIVIIGPDGLIRIVNASTEKIFGYTREELVGEPVEALLPERFRNVHAGHRGGYFAMPRMRPMGWGPDLAGRRKDGSEFPVEISLTFADTGTGRLAMAFITDITERRRTEAQLRRQQAALHQAEKLTALGTLAAGLAHEINNPIGIISSRIELMLSEPENEGLPAGVREDLRVLQRNVARVSQIAHGLLSLARQSPRERRPIDLNRVVEETLLLARKQLFQDGVEVRARLDSTLPPLLGDMSALQQVTLILLTNAREALAGPGKVFIETRHAPGQAGWIQLVVADNGPGIASEVLPKIFDPFFTTKSRGTGLGLSLTYGIVRDHHGTIDVQSETGRGATFVLTFPVAPELEQPA